MQLKGIKSGSIIKGFSVPVSGPQYRYFLLSVSQSVEGIITVWCLLQGSSGHKDSNVSYEFVPWKPSFKSLLPLEDISSFRHGLINSPSERQISI
jgi:hypothetical protein